MHRVKNYLKIFKRTTRNILTSSHGCQTFQMFATNKLIMFGNEDLIGTCIDFLATALPYTGMSFGTFLLHNSQVFGSKAIERKSSGSIKDNVTTVLSCLLEIEFY